MKKRKNAKKIAYAAAILILAFVMLYSGLRIAESTVLHRNQGMDVPVESKTIIKDGVEYFPRQDLTVVMVLGIDQAGPVEDSGTYNNRGAADMVTLVIFDETNKVCNMLHLNRDTMVEMPVLGVGGRKAGTYFGQLALSHTYGSGLEDSCQNTLETVSDFLYGIRIDYYVALHMDAIPILNDAVGGVRVNVTDDFSQIDPSIKKGQVTLMGDQVLTYVRTRQGLGDQLNLSRMERQKEYVTNFANAFRAGREGSGEFVAGTYEKVSPYLVTDCSLNVIDGMIDRYGDYELGETVSPDGKNVLGEKYYEFYADEEKLDELILRLFYAPKE